MLHSLVKNISKVIESQTFRDTAKKEKNMHAKISNNKVKYKTNLGKCIIRRLKILLSPI